MDISFTTEIKPVVFEYCMLEGERFNLFDIYETLVEVRGGGTVIRNTRMLKVLTDIGVIDKPGHQVSHPLWGTTLKQPVADELIALLEQQVSEAYKRMDDRKKRLRMNLLRNSERGFCGGVCAGIAKEYDIEPIWMRLAFVLGTIAGFGFPIIVYIFLWFIMEED